MTPEQLMKPRYRVIADYPNNTAKIGTTYEIDLKDTWSVMAKDIYDDYPHLFRKLEWWEERKIEDMPEYVKVIEGSKCSVKNFGKVTEWHTWDNPEPTQGTFYAFIEGNEYQNHKVDVKHFLPATLAQYTTYLSQQQ